MVFVDTQADMVRLSDDCRGHVYFFKEGEWIRSKNVVTLPEGWFAGPIEKENDE